MSVAQLDRPEHPEARPWRPLQRLRPVLHVLALPRQRGDQRQGPGPCPALIPGEDGSRWACGVLKRPDRYATRFAMKFGATATQKAAFVLIGAGMGCDAQTEDEPADPAFITRLQAMGSRADVQQALRLFGFGSLK